MTSESVRLNPLLGKPPSRHDEEPFGADAAAPDRAARTGVGEGIATPAPAKWRLRRQGDKVLFLADSGDGAGVPARLLWARPLSSRGSGVSVMMAEKKSELAYLDSLGSLDPESRVIAEEELAGSVILPRITSIVSIVPKFGNYYWQVETDRGAARFLFTSPESNSFRPLPDVVVLKDTSGNCYEIRPVSGLDQHSRDLFEMML